MVLAARGPRPQDTAIEAPLTDDAGAVRRSQERLENRLLRQREARHRLAIFPPGWRGDDHAAERTRGDGGIVGTLGPTPSLAGILAESVANFSARARSCTVVNAK